MTKIKISLLTILGLTLTPWAHASPVTTDYISSPDGLTIVVGKRTYTLPSSPTKSEQLADLSSSQSPTNKTFDHTSNVRHRKVGVWDYTVSGGAAGTYSLVSMPASALIQNAYIDVITAPNTSTGSPTISIGVNAVGDILAASTYSNLSAGLSIGKEGSGSTLANQLATALRLSTASTVNLIIANSANLSTGKIKLYLDYFDESD